MENIHSETYSLLIDTYSKDLIEMDRLCRGMDTIHAVAREAEWSIQWIGREH